MGSELPPTSHTSDVGDLRQYVLGHTCEGTAALVPEVRLRLLREDSPLWRAFADDWDPEVLARPYWAFAWSGGQAVARYVLDHPEMVAGRRVLDFGAGGGIASIAAARAGAVQVTACDVDPVSAAAVALNAACNAVTVDAVVEDLLHSENRGWDVLLAGDICYDSRLVRHAFPWFQSLVSEGVLVLLGDPGRHHSRSAGLEELARYQARSVPDVEHPEMQTVSVYRVLAAES
jgi:predicted nicotinamide N-methyase